MQLYTAGYAKRYSNEACDIISSIIQGSAGDICYIFEHLTSPKFL
jgi:hypothetical protein